ncbi:MAG TPA: 2OG-Fe(II) oxygenase [Steroidobacteraceae bacterium]|nr:2OG-Fe(II) oxygenase [Steroidobacteraceae bacterium]
MAVRDAFLSPREVRALAGCARARRGRGEFAEGRIGAGPRIAQRTDVRGDSICWLTQPQGAAEARILGRLEALRQRLNREAFLGLFDLELHYAWYPPGAGYARHVDQPLGRAQRRVSLVLYLNEDWSTGDGGALRMHGEQGAQRDIEPLGGRLVAFLTESRQHEVLPARRARLSLTGWLRARE